MRELSMSNKYAGFILFTTLNKPIVQTVLMLMLSITTREEHVCVIIMFNVVTYLCGNTSL